MDNSSPTVEREIRKDDAWRQEVRNDISKLFDYHKAIDKRTTGIENQIAANTILIHAVNKDTKLIVDIMNNVEGFFRFCNMIGKWAKNLLGIFVPVLVLIYAWLHGTWETVLKLFKE